MNEKRAKLKAIVIAFALVFSGFATLMLVPQSVAAADPTVTTMEATDVGATVATLHMEFNMTGYDEVRVYFNWTADGWTTHAWTDMVTYSDAENDTEHHEIVTDLTPDTEYHYKAALVYWNATTEENVTIEGGPEAFTTEVVTVTTLDASNVCATKATMHMDFDMGELDEVTVYFNWTADEWATHKHNGSHEFGAGNTTHYYSLVDLTPDHTYHYKAVLVYYCETDEENKTIEGDVVEFTTLVASVVTLPATGVGLDSATLNMEFNMGEQDKVTVWFEMDGTMVEDSNVTYEAGNTTHSFALSGLTHNTVYAYTAVLMYLNETEDEIHVYGEEVEFATYSSVAIDGPEMLMVGVDGTFEADVTGTAVEYEWVIGGEVVGDEATLDYNWTTIGPRTVSLTIVDDNGLEASATHSLDIRVEVTVTVVDEDDDPIADANVALRADLGFDALKTTGADGTATFEVRSVTGAVHEDEPADMDFETTVSHVDYESETESFTGVEHTVTMTARTEWEVIVGPVQDVHDMVIPDVDVELHWNDEMEHDVTTSEGIVVFTFDFNPYDIEFTAVLTHDEYRAKTVTFTGATSGVIVMTDEPYEFAIGPVVDAEDETPLEGVSVTVTVGDWSEEGFTDENGHAEFFVMVFNPDDIDTYHVELDHADYQSLTIEDYELGDTIEMQKVEEDYHVRVGPIKNRANQFVNDATVTISWNNNLTQTSGVNGMYTFEIPFDPAGVTFTYTISHPDLAEDVTGTFTGAESGEIELEIGEPQEPTVIEEGMSMALIGGIAVLILIIIVVVVMMMKKKPAEAPAEDEEFPEEEPLFEEEEPLFEEEEELFEEEEEPLFEEEEELFEEEEL